MADLVSMRADAAALRQDMENILSTDAELTVDQVAELDAKREKLEKLQDQVHRAESIDAAREAVARPTFKFPSGQQFTANRDAFGEVTDRQLFFERVKAQFRGEKLSDRFIDFGSAASGYTNNAASLLPVTLQDEMVRLLGSVSAVRNAATVRSYASDVEIPIVTARATITATTLEGVAYDTFEPDFGKVRFRAFKTAAETEITEEAIADARGGLVDEILQQHSEAHGYYWETAYCATTAAASSTAPDGLRCTEASLSSAGFSDDAGTTVIADVTTASGGTTVSAVTYQNLLDVAFGMPAKYWGLDKSWIMSPALYQHVLGLTDDSGSVGRPLFQARATGTIQDSAVLGSLFGYPVLVSDAPTEGTPAGKFQAILLERGSYIIADRQGIASQMDEFTRGAEGITAFRTRMRSDGRWVRPSSSARLKISAT